MKNQIIKGLFQQKIAVIIIDLQNDYVHPQGVMGKTGLGLENIQKTIPKIKHFMDLVRTKKVPIIHIQMTEDETEIDPILKRKRISEFGDPKNWSLAKKGSWGHALTLPAKKDEKIFQKNTLDIFSNHDLKKHLKKNKIRTIIILGSYTHACVDSSVRSAATHGFDVVLATDLVGSPDSLNHLHNASLETLTAQLAYGMISDEIIQSMHEKKSIIKQQG